MVLDIPSGFLCVRIMDNRHYKLEIRLKLAFKVNSKNCSNSYLSTLTSLFQMLAEFYFIIQFSRCNTYHLKAKCMEIKIKFQLLTYYF